MLATGPNQSGVFTVSLNPAASTPAAAQPNASAVQSFQSTLILPQPVQQVAPLPQLVSGGHIVNLTPVKAQEQISRNANKTHCCSYCHKQFSSRYNVTRHEKICKLNSSISTVAENIGTDAKHFFCMLCQKMFGTEDALNNHQKKCKANSMVVGYRQTNASFNTGRKIHLCKYCAKEFSTKWNVIRHEKLFHTPNDPIVIPPSGSNGTAASITLIGPPGKPERYCRFCGNYFSSKYNAIRHEKICTRVQENANNSKDNEQQQQQQQQPQTLQIQQDASSKPLQITSITGSSQPPGPGIVVQEQQQQQQQQQQPPPQPQQPAQQQDQQRIHQQIVQQSPINQQMQHNQIQTNVLQNNQAQQILPQQTMLLIEQPSTPFHVCKFCNKQLSTRCDPGTTHNLLSNVPTVATITGQPMQIGSSGTQIAGLVAPVMASLPQVTLVQPQFSTLQGQQMIQQPNQMQHNKDGMQAAQPEQQHSNQQSDATGQHQQITLQHVRLHPQQLQTTTLPQIQHITIPGTTQLQSTPAQPAERCHSCKYCDKRFATKWYLDQHEKIHTGEADMCKECGKYFVTRWHLDKHMRVHMTAGASAAKRSKKDSTTSTTPVLPSNSVTCNVSDITFTQVIVAPSQTSPSDNSSAAAEPTATFSSATSGSQQFFLPAMEHDTSQATSETTTTTPSSHPEEHSTIDKSQIASTLSISYV